MYPSQIVLQRLPRALNVLFSLIVVCMAAGLISAAQADQIVALGASNTEGKGVSRSDSYPSQLEEMLKTQGVNVKVVNEGITGDTVFNMINRLDRAVPEGTRVVIFQPGGNDAREGANPESIKSNIAKVVERLQARGIKVIMLRNSEFKKVPGNMFQSDGIHLTPEGYRLLASNLLPKVLEALKQ